MVRSTSCVAEEILSRFSGYTSSMHPVDENPLLRNSMELAAAYSQLVFERWQFVAGCFGLVMGQLVAVVSLFPYRDWQYL